MLPSPVRTVNKCGIAAIGARPEEVPALNLRLHVFVRDVLLPLLWARGPDRSAFVVDSCSRPDGSSHTSPLRLVPVMKAGMGLSRSMWQSLF